MDHSYFCRLCKLQLNSKQQWDDHIIGTKHQRASVQSQIQLPAVAEVTTNTENKIFCKVCPEFFCTGVVPMQAHLAGKKHKKNMERSGASNSPSPTEFFQPDPLPGPNICVVNQHLTLSPEQRIQQAWKHESACNIPYNDSFSDLSPTQQINALSPHFGFISSHEGIPALQHYLLNDC